jgi:hypothetical protein
VHEPVGALATAVAEHERPLGADGQLAPRRRDELLLPGRPPHAGAGGPAAAPGRREVEEEALLAGVACARSQNVADQLSGNASATRKRTCARKPMEQGTWGRNRERGEKATGYLVGRDPMGGGARGRRRG